MPREIEESKKFWEACPTRKETTEKSKETSRFCLHCCYKNIVAIIQVLSKIKLFFNLVGITIFHLTGVNSIAKKFSMAIFALE